MHNVLKEGQFVNDDWVLVDSSVESLEATPAGKLILPLTLWLANQEKTASDGDNFGVWLDSDESPTELADHAETIQLICINFPAFTDGRGYSIARQLRTHCEFQGELRAIGNVLRDQLQFYQRCGFTSYAFAEEPKDRSIQTSLEDFSVHYQDAADNYLPPFARR